MRGERLIAPEEIGFSNEDLAPIEYLMIHGSIRVNGILLNNEWLKEVMERYKIIPDILLKPVSLIEKKRDSSHVKRNRQNKRYLRNMFSLFEGDEKKLGDLGWSPALELSSLNGRSQKIKPQWNVVVFDGRGGSVDATTVSDTLNLDASLPSYLKHIIDEQNNIVLHVRGAIDKTPHEIFRNRYLP